MLIDAVRQDVPGPERAPLLALRADMLMATGDAGAILAYREALAATADPAERRLLLPRLARAATFAGDYATAGEALDGLEPDGSAGDAALLLQRGILAHHTGDLGAAEAAADEARRRLGVADPGDWRLYDLISLQGLIAHLRGRWFSRLAVELRAGAGRPDLARSIFDSHLCVAEFLLYGPTPYEEVLALAATLRESARRSGVLRAVAFATALHGEAALSRATSTSRSQSSPRPPSCTTTSVPPPGRPTACSGSPRSTSPAATAPRPPGCCDARSHWPGGRRSRCTSCSACTGP